MTAPPLIGTYTPPPVRKGQRVTCLYRDGDAVVTSWTAAPIPWPRCRAVESRGGSGLLMSEELHRAVLTESAIALRYWFGASPTAVLNWRRWAGATGHTTTPGSRAAQRAASEAGADALRGERLCEAECERRSEWAKRTGHRPPDRWAETGWTADEDKLLGTAADEVVAARVGRSLSAVRSRRHRLGIPPP